MTKRISLAIFLTGILSASVGYSSDGVSDGSDVEFQYNTITSLMSGNYNTVVTVGEAKEKVNFGLGALKNLGELMVLNGKYYEADANGDIKELDDNAGISYLTGTYLVPDKDKTFTLKDVSLLEMEQAINEYNQKNGNARYYAAMIVGTFASVIFRSEDKANTKPGIPLPEWMKYHQKQYSLSNVEGSMILLELPDDIQGVGVPGDHVHFISQMKTRGGHVLDAKIKKASVIFQPLKVLKVYPNVDKASLHELHEIESSTR